MAITRTVARTTVTAIALLALTVFSVLPAEGHRTRETAAEPIVGPELPVAYPMFDTPQSGDEPAVAFGGSVYLTAWRDSERGVVAARVDRAGAVIDRLGISLTDGEFG